jgi:hypothetical protein
MTTNWWARASAVYGGVRPSIAAWFTTSGITAAGNSEPWASRHQASPPVTRAANRSSWKVRELCGSAAGAWHTDCSALLS